MKGNWCIYIVWSKGLYAHATATVFVLKLLMWFLILSFVNSLMDQQQTIRTQLARVSAPGKVILCGEHAVVYGEDALAMSIDLRCSATIYLNTSHADSRLIRINIAQNDKIHNYDIVYEQTITPFVHKSSPEYHHYAEQRQKTCDDPQQIKIQYKYLACCKHLNIQPQTQHSLYEIDIRSQIPIGKCLGSSAAFNTVFATAMVYLYADKCEIDNLGRICALSKQLQKVEHGTPSGLDNYVSTYGGLMLYNHTKQPHFVRLDKQQIVETLSNSIQMKLVDSGVEKDTKKAIAIVRQHWQSDEKYRQMIKDIGGFPNKIVELLHKCSEGPVCQLQAVIQILNTLKLNHEYLRELGVSIPQIQQIVKRETVKGSSCAKITGAGMGGYVLVLSTPKHTPQTNKEYLCVNFSAKGLDAQVFSHQL